MILNELCDYYDVLSNTEDAVISPFGYEINTAAYEAVLTSEGVLVGINAFTKDSKNYAKNFMTPKSMKTKAIAASPVMDFFEYIFGIGGKNGDKEFTEVKFKSAKELHLSLFGQAQCEEAAAIVKFFESWDIWKAWENEYILSIYSPKGNAFSGKIVFRLAGRSDSGTIEYFHEVPEIRDIWLQKNKENLERNGSDIRQCSITGKTAPIAKLHGQFKGVKGASTMGASLVCFNNDSDLSYNLEQSFNSAVSQEAAFKYATALRYMLDDNKQKIYIGDDTAVFWASSTNNLYTDIFYLMFNPPQEDEREDKDTGRSVDPRAEEAVRAILKSGSKGIFRDFSGFDGDVKFCVLGLSPNAGRISVRFFFLNTFKSFCEKIKLHYDDISITGIKPYIKIRSLLLATISSKSKDKKINPLLAGAVTGAILTGGLYPQLLLNQILIRVKTEAVVTQPRAAAIKGYLVRKARILNKKEEEINMSLNEHSKNTAYVMGRVFAILEKIQKDALGNLNSTIKDKYFAAACSNPSLVFPNLLKLTQHHLAKIEGRYLDNLLSNCLNLIEGESFPKILHIEDQGRFILGYYHQNHKLYEKKDTSSHDKEEI